MSHDAPQSLRRILAAGATLAPGYAMAHPDHSNGVPGSTMEQLLHLVTQPDHLLMLAAVVGLAVWSFRKRRNAS